MRETSQRGPDIPSDEREREHEEFKAFQTKLISLWSGCSLRRVAREPLALGIAKLKLPSHFGVRGLK